MSVTEYTFFSPGSGDAWRTGSMSPSPLTLLGPFNFDFSTAGLTTGVKLCRLPVGAVIYDVGIAISVTFDGTTPLADVGSFVGGNVGLFGELAGAAVDLTSDDSGVTDNTDLFQSNGPNWLAAAVGSVGAAGGATYLPAPLTVSAVSTLMLAVSQNGQKGGTAVGSTAGAGAVYVLAATPYTS